MASPFISVIVPTRNRSVLLSRLLESLATLRYPHWDVIVVDDGSIDETAAVAEHFRARGLPLTYIWQPWQKMGAARNRALAEARREIVAFTDDDCVVDPGWLDAIAATFAAHPEALGVQGKTVTDHAAMTPFTRQVEQLEGGQPYRTCNIAYRTTTVRELGGFDPHLIRGEDVVMGQRVLERGPIVFAPDAVVYHPPRPKEWADRRAWRTLLESEVHFKRTYPTYMPARSPTLSLQRPEHVLSRWVLLPIRRYWRWHCGYLRREPLDYLRQVPRIVGEKMALFSLLPYFVRRWWGDGVEEREDLQGVPSPPSPLSLCGGRGGVSISGGACTPGPSTSKETPPRPPQRERGLGGEGTPCRSSLSSTPSPHLDTATPPLASIIIPTHNRAALLPRLLAALEEQDYPNFEVIVVDDGSTDETGAILGRWQREGRVALRQERSRGSYAARNLGWRRARGEIIAFTDDDCLPLPGWLAALVEVFQSGEIVGAQGVTLAQPGEVTPFTHQIEQTRPGPPYRTCNIGYRRSLLADLGGFDESFRWYADNILGLHARQQGTIALARDAVVLHPPRPKGWRDRATWLARFRADARHRQILQGLGLEPRLPRQSLPILLWIVRPLVKQSWVHARYAAQHPLAYLRHLPIVVRDKWELLQALRLYRGELYPTDAPDRLQPLPAEPLVSVVVVTRGCSPFLADLLSELSHQTWKRHEVIVIDHAGDAASQALAARNGARHVHAAGGTLGAARQRGVEEARGEIVAFTDDDCLPDAGWLAAIVESFRRQPVLWGVQGRTVMEDGPIGAHGVRVSHRDSLFQTCNIAYRRAALERVQGFDARFSGWFEDTALGARVSSHGPIGWSPGMLVTHRAVPRRLLGRAAWRALLSDERRLARDYRVFYWRTRGPGFLLTVVGRWLIGSPLKTLVSELPRARENPRRYLALAGQLIHERVELVHALADIVVEQR
jgi:glycosyltransferase involved in cell wall biosynthesis